MTCHPSCDGCTGGVCNACKGAPNAVRTFIDNSACVCQGGTGGQNTYHESCGVCDNTCAQCWIAGDSSKCHTCPDQTIPPKGTLIGSCGCGEGFVPVKDNVSAACVHCASGCTACYGPAATECLTSEQQDFILMIETMYPLLPITHETSAHLLCYRQTRPTWDTSGCSTEPVLAVLGDISGYGTLGSGNPTLKQCSKWLAAQWPFVTHWFTHLFPNFTGPTPVTIRNTIIQSILYLWILQFGPSEMSDDAEWGTLKADLVAGGNWLWYYGWAGENPGYVTNGPTSTRKTFPQVLEDWIKSADGCNKNTPTCLDLMVFDYGSTTCDQTPCNIQSECGLINPSSNCATYSR